MVDIWQIAARVKIQDGGQNGARIYKNKHLLLSNARRLTATPWRPERI